MTAGIWNPTCEQGATFSHVITYSDELGAAIDLTGWTPRMDVRASKSKTATLILSLTAANGRITVSDAAAGQITIAVPSSVTTALTPGLYYYDIELEDVGGTIIRLLQGTFTVDAEVTGS